MPHTLIRKFHEFNQAQRAREALLAEGFNDDAVSLTASEDEAGPTAGNFALDRASKLPGAAEEDGALAAQEDPRANSQALLYGTYILSIATDDSSRLARAADIADSHGAIDV